ncbi:MAG: LolA-related protein [Rubrivivax sp.]
MLLGVSLHAAALELHELAALLAQHRNAEATFVEDRFVSGIDQPLRSSGTLVFTPPDRFTRTTLQPQREVMSVDGNRLLLERGGRTRRMALDALPEAGGLIDALRGVLSGELTGLQSSFDARVLGSATRWRLSLRPRAQRLGSALRQLDIEGEGPDVRTIEVLLSGGDRSLMTLRAVDASASAGAIDAAPASASAPRR